jgi:hypothetical protein
MTNDQTVTTPSTQVVLPPVGPVRRSLAVLAAVATLPYLALKVGWLAGGRLGLQDPEFGQGAAMLTLNALTMLLDVVALALAVVLMTRRGMRAPAWLVLPPVWVGAGLLGQILVALPLSVVARAVSPSRPSTGPLPPIEEWVFTMVYVGFGLLGVGLLGSFAVYAWQRWGGQPIGPPTGRARVWLAVAAGLTATATLAHLAVSGVPLASRLLDLVVAGVTVGALVALRRPAVRERAGVVAVVLAFVGTGAVCAWGTYLAVITAVPNDLVGQTQVDWATVAVNALRTVAGLVGAGALLARTRSARTTNGSRRSVPDSPFVPRGAVCADTRPRLRPDAR